MNVKTKPNTDTIHNTYKLIPSSQHYMAIMDIISQFTHQFDKFGLSPVKIGAVRHLKYKNILIL